MLHHDPVLTLQGHHIRHGGERHIIQQVIGQVDRQTEHRDERLHQLERDPGAAEASGAGGVFRALRVHHRDRGRQDLPGQVVVGDDDTDTRRPRPLHRLHGRDATVAGDDERRARQLGRLEPGVAEIVPVTQAVREEGDDVCLGRPQGAGEEGGGTLAVDVVVAVDENRAARPHGGRDRVHRVAHSGQGVRIGELIERRTEIAAGRVGLRLTALHQQGGQSLGKMQAIGERPHGGVVRPSRHDPLEHRGLKDAHHGSLLPHLLTKRIPPARLGTGSRRMPHSCPAPRRCGSESGG